jgi:hypothetical protein
MESNFGLLLCPKSIKNGQIITDLAKTVHVGMYYCNKLQLNFKKKLKKNSNFSKNFKPDFSKNFEIFSKKTTSIVVILIVDYEKNISCYS